MSTGPRKLLAVAGLAAGGVLLGAGAAVAGSTTSLTPGVYASWGPNVATSGGVAVAEGKGVFGERSDATAVGGTQYTYDPRPGGDAAFVSATYWFYGPDLSCDSGSCWYLKDSDRFANWSQASWHAQYGSTPLVGSADRARGYYKACADKSWAPDPCSATSILTTSY
jgi:hypothetical protein